MKLSVGDAPTKPKKTGERNNMKKLAIVAIITILSLVLGCTALAEEIAAEVIVEPVAETAVEAPKAAAVEEPVQVEAPAQEIVEAPVAEIAETPVEETVAQPAEETAEAPVQEIAEVPAVEDATAPVEAIAEETVAQPAEETAEETTEEVAAEVSEEAIEEATEEIDLSSLKVEIFSTLGERAQEGDRVTLTSRLTGFENIAYALQWEVNDGNGWRSVEGATGDSHTYTVNADTIRCEWRLTVSF